MALASLVFLLMVVSLARSQGSRSSISGRLCFRRTIELDNNTVERSIRPLALTRKSSLFAGSDGRADLASLIETAKLNDIDPQGYMTSVITRILEGHPQSQIDQLMPWNHDPKSVKLAT